MPYNDIGTDCVCSNPVCCGGYAMTIEVKDKVKVDSSKYGKAVVQCKILRELQELNYSMNIVVKALDCIARNTTR